jgi:hypothetical protein
VRYLALVLAFGLVALLLVDSQLKIITHIRYALYLWPVVAAMFAVGLIGLRRRWLLAVCALWAAAGVWNTFTPTFNDALGGRLGGESLNRLFRLYLPFPAFVDIVERESQPDDFVAFHLPDYQWMFREPYDYYRPVLPRNNTILEDVPFDASQPASYAAQLRQRLTTAARAWVGIEKYFPSTSKLDALQQALADEGFTLCGPRYDDAEMRVDLYARETTCCAPSQPPDQAVRMGNVALQTLHAPTEVDGTLQTLVAVWGDPALDAAAYSLALHVTGASGQPQTQLDLPLTGALFSCRVIRIPVSHLSAGRYSLRAAVYNWMTGERLPLTGGGDMAVLGELTVP